VPDSALSVSGQSVHVHLTEEGVIDSGFFLGPGTDYASATIDITWTPSGKVNHFRPGSTDPTDPSDFSAEFRDATAVGDFTVLLNGVTFTITGATSSGVFAEMGNEKNGSFLGN
jgi:hypothetical protein